MEGKRFVTKIIYWRLANNLLQWNLYKADIIGTWKKCPLYGDVFFIEIPYKNEYLVKINQEWVFEVNGFHRIKKGHVEIMKWKMFLLQKEQVKCYYFKTKIKS